MQINIKSDGNSRIRELEQSNIYLIQSKKIPEERILVIISPKKIGIYLENGKCDLGWDEVSTILEEYDIIENVTDKVEINIKY